MKQVIIIRRDLKMRRGKEIAQGAHASIGAMEFASKDVVETWRKFGSKKICLQVQTEDELHKLAMLARSADIPTYLVRDHGSTEIDPGTVTSLALGPAEEFDLDPITENLKLY